MRHFYCHNKCWFDEILKKNRLSSFRRLWDQRRLFNLASLSSSELNSLSRQGCAATIKVWIRFEKPWKLVEKLFSSQVKFECCILSFSDRQFFSVFYIIAQMEECKPVMIYDDTFKASLVTSPVLIPSPALVGYWCYRISVLGPFGQSVLKFSSLMPKFAF